METNANSSLIVATICACGSVTEDPVGHAPSNPRRMSTAPAGKCHLQNLDVMVVVVAWTPFQHVGRYVGNSLSVGTLVPLSVTQGTAHPVAKLYKCIADVNGS